MNWVVEYRPIHTLAESILGIDSWAPKMSLKNTVTIVESILGSSDPCEGVKDFRIVVIICWSKNSNMTAVSRG